jgi:hypothetical protein
MIAYPVPLAKLVKVVPAPNMDTLSGEVRRGEVPQVLSVRKCHSAPGVAVLAVPLLFRFIKSEVSTTPLGVQ